MVTLIFNKNVNPLYLYEAVQDQIKSSFAVSKPQLTLLADFLTKPAYNELLASVSSSKSREVFVPHKFSFDSVDHRGELFSSKEFLEFVRLVTGVRSNNATIDVKKFKHTNFTLLHDDLDSNARVIFFYILGSKDWKPEWGGQTIFTFGDGREPIVFEPKANSLAIIKVPKGMRDFVKYIKHFSGRNEFFKIEGTLS